MPEGAVLEVEGLRTEFHSREGIVRPVNGVSFSVMPRQTLAIMGESGAGKTITAYSILDLVPYPGKVVAGKILFEGRDLRSMKGEELRKIRGKEIACVFQDAQMGLNPLLTIGVQLEEVIASHLHVLKKEARGMAEASLGRVGMPDPKSVMGRYTFQLSGGMCQRVMLAMAMILSPKVLIADEPTTGLDVTLQAEILHQMRVLKDKLGSAILLISHDLGVIAQMADEVAVMYAGYIVERAETVTLFQKPRHPYTWGLMRSIPNINRPDDRLVSLSGGPPDLKELGDGCPFLGRCNKAVSECRLKPMPPLQEVAPGHWVACYNPIRHDWD